MFLPLERRPDWRNPPLITLILVIANVLIFYMWQFNDKQYEQDAYSWYEDQGLDMIELKKYSEYLAQQDDTGGDRFTQDKPVDRYQRMLADGRFQRMLDNSQIIKPDEPDYHDWRTKRDDFKKLLNRSVTERYSINPSQPRLLTYFSSLFLHDDSAHLIGNMIILVLLGLGLELIIGRLLFLTGYVMAGLSGNLLYVVLYSHSAIPSLGASGAIAGVLGMAIMIYGFRKINFFYFLLVYFDFVRARAIWILPLYVLSQAIIYFVFGSQINVAAHIGGLAGGLAFAALLKLVPSAIRTEIIDESQHREAYSKELTRAQQLIAKMKIDEAKNILDSLERKYPDDVVIQQNQFTIAKYNPASEDYHRYAKKLMMLQGTDPATIKAIHDTYQHYAKRARPKPRWTPELLANIAIRFAAGGRLNDAEKIANTLVKAMKEFEKNAEVLSALTKYYKDVDDQKTVLYKNMLLELYPDSIEAKHVQ
jgi:membrane associated rhomboid family serine protease